MNPNGSKNALADSIRKNRPRQGEKSIAENS